LQEIAKSLNASQALGLCEECRQDGCNSETKRMHRRLLVAIERADFLEPLMQSRDQV